MLQEISSRQAKNSQGDNVVTVGVPWCSHDLLANTLLSFWDAFGKQGYAHQLRIHVNMQIGFASKSLPYGLTEGDLRPVDNLPTRNLAALAHPTLSYVGDPLFNGRNDLICSILKS